MKTTIIGDVHGKFDRLNMIVKCLPDNRIIQVGDLGIGFVGYAHPLRFNNNFQFIRGNHDNPSVCKTHQNYLGEYGNLDEIFFIGGALSIDKDSRTIGYDYWDDEELSWVQLMDCLELYAKIKPKVVVSHDCPTLAKPFHGFDSRTQAAMQTMYESHQPDLWVYGHYHVSRKEQIGRTKFVCLNELECFTYE